MGAALRGHIPISGDENGGILSLAPVESPPKLTGHFIQYAIGYVRPLPTFGMPRQRVIAQHLVTVRLWHRGGPDEMDLLGWEVLVALRPVSAPDRRVGWQDGRREKPAG